MAGIHGENDTSLDGDFHIFHGKVQLVLLGKPVDLQQVHEWFDHLTSQTKKIW